MFPPGHAGIAMIAFSPIAFALVVFDREEALAEWLLAALLLTLVPDLDLLVPALAHRGASHTLLAAVSLGALAGAVARATPVRSLGAPGERALLGFTVGTVSVVGHVFGDLVTPKGIQPFLPFDETAYTLSLVHAHHSGANLVLLGVGLVTLAASVSLARLTVPSRDDPTDDATVDSTVDSDAGPG